MQIEDLRSDVEKKQEQLDEKQEQIEAAAAVEEKGETVGGASLF